MSYASRADEGDRTIPFSGGPLLRCCGGWLESDGLVFKGSFQKFEACSLSISGNLVFKDHSCNIRYNLLYVIFGKPVMEYLSIHSMSVSTPANSLILKAVLRACKRTNCRVLDLALELPSPTSSPFHAFTCRSWRLLKGFGSPPSKIEINPSNCLSNSVVLFKESMARQRGDEGR